MNNLKELEKKYEELGKAIEKLKRERANDISKDPIFLLSAEEYKKYKDKIPQINCGWWLRSPGASFACTALVDANGFISNFGIGIKYDGEAVRPVLKIPNLKYFKAIKVDETHIFFCGITWVKIDEDLYIAEVPITFIRFDENSNDYTESEIRKFLLDWYETRKTW